MPNNDLNQAFLLQLLKGVQTELEKTNRVMTENLAKLKTETRQLEQSNERLGKLEDEIRDISETITRNRRSRYLACFIGCGIGCIIGKLLIALFTQ